MKPSGGKWWRVDYRHQGKRQTLSAGVYPKTSLKAARAERDRIRAALDVGIDPALQRKERAMADAEVDTLECVVLEWHGKNAAKWTPRYAARVMNLFKHDIFPYLGAVKLEHIDAPTLLAVLRRMEARGLTDSVLRAREICGAMFRYGVATGRCTTNPADALRGALVRHAVQHHAAIIDPRKFGQLLRDIDAYPGSFVVQSALKLTPLLALRPGELRRMEWSEIDLTAREIRIPGVKMKMRSDHIVPLVKQAMSILTALYPLTGHGQHVLPSIRHPRGNRPMSENTINAALRSLGYDGKEMSAHGFRGSFCSLANEKLHFNPDAIERQLAHAERNKVRAAYLHTEYLPERRKLMQAWADYLDSLREGSSNVIPLKAATG